MKSSDKQLLKNSAVASIDAVAGLVPGLSIAWGLSKALLGNGIALRQQSAMEWVEMIRREPAIFQRDILDSREFQDGFVVALEDYLKTRSILKRSMAEKIFREFTRCDDKVEFQLERYNDTLRKISDSGIKFLAFLDQTISPLREKEIQAKVNAMDLSKSDKSREWWVEQKRMSQAYSETFNKWLQDNFSPNSEALRNKYGKQGIIPKELIDKLFEHERVERMRYWDNITELDFLGIIKVGTGEIPGWGGGLVTQWGYTRFGKSFLEAISSKE